jgi:transposase
MSKHFRPWNIDQTLLLPPSVQNFVPKDHVSRFIVGLARESLDLKAIMGSYVSGHGQPPFDPRMMVSLLLHGYACGLYSSRRIARACRERNDFVMIVALDPPDFRTISDFRKRRLKALGELFLQVLKLCKTAGLVQLGHVALDGTKIKANASKHKAMSYERMKKREAELKAEVAGMLAAAEAADAQEDEIFAKDKRTLATAAKPISKRPASRCRRPSPPRVDPHRKCSAKPPPRRRLLLPTNHLVNRTIEDGWPKTESPHDFGSPNSRPSRR